MDTFASRLTEAMSERGISAADLARASGVPYPTLKGILDGYQQKSSKAGALARALRVNAAWLLDGTPPRDLGQPQQTEPMWADVPGYAQAVSLGDGAEPSEWAETHKLKFRADSLARQHLSVASLAIMYGRGDSMRPLIKDGDAIMFDLADTTPRDEKIYVIQLPGVKGPEYTAKQCVEIAGMHFFQALNPEGDHNWRKPRRLDDPRRPITVIGRVRWVAGWVP